MAAGRELKPLVLHLKREYWELIIDGLKMEEYRLVSLYWQKRLQGKEYSEVHLLLGYPKRGDESRTLKRKWKGFRVIDIEHKHFGGGKRTVYAIDVSEPAE